MLRPRRALLPVAFAIVSAACYAPRTPPAAVVRCAGPPARHAGWRHRWSRVVAGLGPAHHSASDPIVHPGEPVRVAGRFAYGPADKQLEHERVTLWLEESACGTWRRLATARTDEEGRVAIDLPPEAVTHLGPTLYSLVVDGDRSAAYGMIWVLPRGAPIVVLDVDGTLTTGDRQLAGRLALGTPAAVRPGAARLVRRYRARGVQPVYLTGRPTLLRAATRAWLESRGFPPGPILTAPGLGAALPTASHVGAFKRAALRHLVDTGLHIEAAYGNARTDVCAYAEAGIDPARTFIVGDHAGAACPGHAPTRPIADYRTRVRKVDAARAVSPPPARPRADGSERSPSAGPP
jgi:phosphatidate phosphatase PAH1